MKRTLRSEGLVGSKLFSVAGDLVAGYNRALKTITGKEIALTSFYIDKAGASPEVEAELGKDYLRCGTPNRYIIIISPEQMNAELLREEFSFDNSILNFLYSQHLPGIETVTRADCMYGPIDTGLKTCESIDDLLLLRNVKIDLQTPSGFIKNARELQKLAKKLEESPDLLVADDSSLPKQMLELVQKVGDVRGYNISDFSVQQEVGNFYSSFFGGIYVFREEDNFMKRSKTDCGIFVPSQTTVVYNPASVETRPEDGPRTSFAPIDDIESVVSFLLKKKCAHFSEKLILARLGLLEDLSLIQNGYDVNALSPEEKARYLSKVTPKKAHANFHELKSLHTTIAKGYSSKELIKEATISTKAMLLEPSTGNPYVDYVVGKLLTEIWPYDYAAMYQYNKNCLEEAFDNSDDITRNYIVGLLKNQSQN